MHYLSQPLGSGIHLEGLIRPRDEWGWANAYILMDCLGLLSRKVCITSLDIQCFSCEGLGIQKRIPTKCWLGRWSFVFSLDFRVMGGIAPKGDSLLKIAIILNHPFYGQFLYLKATKPVFYFFFILSKSSEVPTLMTSPIWLSSNGFSTVV